MLRRAIPLVLAAFVAAGAQAKTTDAAAKITLPAGDPAFAHRPLQPYENVWRYTATLPDGQVKIQGLWTDRADPIEKNGRKLMRRVQGMTYVNGIATSQINVFDPATMQPVSSEVHRVDGSWLKRTFNGATVTETRGDSPKDTVGKTSSFAAPSRVLDYWGGMYGTLLASLPLSMNYSGTLPAVDEFEPKYKPASFKVVRQEMLSAGHLGKLLTWVVESEGMTFWLSERAPYVVKLDVPMPNGAVAHWDEL